MEGTWEAWFDDFGDLRIEIAIGGLGIDQAKPTFVGSPVGIRLAATASVADYLREGEAPTTTTTTTGQSIALPPTGQDATTTLAGLAALAALVGTALVGAARARPSSQPDASA
jgi:hypothetical protein